MPLSVQDLLNTGKLTNGHARALLAIEDEDRMIELANRVVKENLTVRDIEKLAKAKPIKPKKEKENDPFLENVSRIVENKLQTRVEIDNKKLTIHYNGTEDLNRILEIIGCLED